jgi:hypothetical protein
MKTYLIKKHVKNCSAINHVKKKIWGNPWTICRGEFRFGRLNSPMKSGRRGWLFAICNNTQCKAKIAILAEDIESELPTHDPDTREVSK